MSSEQAPDGAALEQISIAGMVTARNLAAVPDEISPDIRSFVDTMRSLFGALDMSLTRFSAQVYCDKGTVSRYLSGERVPPQDFLDKLLKAFFDKKGMPVAAEAQDLIHEQYLAALRVHSPERYLMQDLSNQLHQALEGSRQSQIHIAALEEAIASRLDRIYQLELEKRSIQNAWAAERQQIEEIIEGERDHGNYLQQTIERLQHEIVQLRKRLRQAQVRAGMAEQRCQELEVLLDTASAAADKEEALSNAHQDRQTAVAREQIAILSPREREVLVSLIQGMLNKQIARSLQVNQSTIDFHVSNIYRKLNINNRVRLAMLARDAGL